MGICKIGEKKEIRGKWYIKQRETDCCHQCAFLRGACPGNATGNSSSVAAIEDGGSECIASGDVHYDTIWVSIEPKPAKPAPKAKWTKIPLDTNIAKSGLIDIANQLGAENARLKNQITKLKGAKA